MNLSCVWITFQFKLPELEMNRLNSIMLYQCYLNRGVTMQSLAYHTVHTVLIPFSSWFKYFYPVPVAILVLY